MPRRFSLGCCAAFLCFRVANSLAGALQLHMQHVAGMPQQQPTIPSAVQGELDGAAAASAEPLPLITSEDMPIKCWVSCCYLNLAHATAGMCAVLAPQLTAIHDQHLLCHTNTVLAHIHPSLSPGLKDPHKWRRGKL